MAEARAENQACLRPYVVTRAQTVGGRRLYEFELLPRREDNHLLRGRIWIDASTYLPRRFQGEPAKSPSWWRLRDVSITLLYGDVSGFDRKDEPY
jgi:hypothetical protein